MAPAHVMTEFSFPIVPRYAEVERGDQVHVLADHLLPIMSRATMTVLEDTGHLSPLEVPIRWPVITTFTAQLN